jgi:hypothetical protein
MDPRLRSAGTEEFAVALTLPRWLAAVIAGVLIIAASVFSVDRAPTRKEDPREALVRAERRAASSASKAGARLRGLMLRDSVRAAIARVQPSTTSRSVLSPGLPPELARFDRVLGVRLDLVRAQQRQEPIDLVFTLDTAASVRSAMLDRPFIGVTHVLPSAPGQRCTSIVQHAPRRAFEDMYPRYWTAYASGVGTASRLLGPCGFYEAFGSPGHGVDEWLAKGGWRFGSSAILRPGYSQRVWLGYSNYWFEPLWARRSGWPLRRLASAKGYRCASGDAEVCKAIILDPNADPQAGRTLPMAADRIVPPSSASVDYESWYMSLGPREARYLADMANDLGPDRFRRFWTSEKAPAEAFADAAGQDLGTWTVAWARRTYGQNGRGPSPDVDTAMWAVLLALSGLGAAVTTSRRRQMA